MNKTLKSFYILFVFLLFLSCSDDNGEKGNDNHLNPPSWTYGTWKDKEGLYTAKFTPDNLIFGNDGIPLNFSEVVKSSGIPVVEFINTDSDYKIGFGSSKFHFRKKSSNQIALVLIDDPELPGEWILYKVELKY